MAPPVVPTAIAIAGGYILWFSVHYWRDTTQVYPSDPLKKLLTGKGLPARDTEGSDVADAQAIFGPNLGMSSSGNTGTPAAGDNPGSGFGTVQLSTAQVESLWTSNGGDPAQAEFASGVVTAESGGDPLSTSSNPDGGTNVGLYQLDTKGEGAGYTVEQLQDPTLNTQITILKTANGTNWSSWADPYITAHGTHGAGG